MLKQKSELNLSTPKILIKRDGVKYPFEIFKLQMILHALDLGEVETLVLSRIIHKLAKQDEVQAQEVADAFYSSLNELGYIDEAKNMLNIGKMTRRNGLNKPILRIV